MVAGDSLSAADVDGAECLRLEEWSYQEACDGSDSRLDGCCNIGEWGKLPPSHFEVEYEMKRDPFLVYAEHNDLRRLYIL